jgi:hypothetical protein
VEAQVAQVQGIKVQPVQQEQAALLAQAQAVKLLLAEMYPLPVEPAALDLELRLRARLGMLVDKAVALALAQPVKTQPRS